MDPATGVATGVAGIVAGLPAAGLVLAFPASGRVALPPRWALGGGARPVLVGTVAAVTGAAAGLVGARLGWSLVLPAFIGACVVGVVLAVVDVRQRRLPFVLSGLVYGGCVACFGVESVLAGSFGPFGRSVMAGVLVVFAFLALALAVPGQLGLGDVVLVGWIAMTLGWLGWGHLVSGLVAGLALQAAGAVVLLVLRRKTVRGELPMGPALLAGWLVAVVVT